MTKLRTLLTTSLVALSGVLAVPAGAFAADDAAGSRAEAKETLAEAERALDGRGLDTGRELTPLLLELSRELPALGREDRKEARGLLARPTDGTADPQQNGYTTAEAPRVCTTHFCVHYVATTDDAPDLSDGSDAGSTPDYVEAMAAEFEFVYAREVGSPALGGLGWRPPEPDGTAGGDARTDVYIKALGPGLYGYAASEFRRAENSATAYQVMDDDYQGFPSPPFESLQVTAAHEFNHVLQFAYDYLEDTWMFESTATWMEDKVYDGINDYRFYLPGWASRTEVPLTQDDGAKIYGSAVWNQWLEGERGEHLPRDAWEDSFEAGSFAPFAYARALTEATDADVLAGTFATAFSEFSADTAEWNAPGSNWEEGSAYPDVERVGALDAGSGAPASAVLDHTTFAHYDVTGAGAGPLTLQATLPAGLRGAIALVERTGGDPRAGTVTTRITQLPNGGVGSVTIPQPAAGGRITAVLVNADLSNSGYAGAPTNDYVWTKDDQPIAARVSSGTPPDSTAPETTITSGPAATTSDHAVRFEFASSEPGVSSFECRFDGAPFASCSSPYTSGQLNDGTHTFEVRATDNAGNTDATPAAYSFTVFTPPPDADADGVPDSSDACPTQAATTLNGCPPPIVDRTPPLAPVVVASRSQSLRRGFVSVACTLREPGSCRAIATVTIPRTRRTAKRVYRVPTVTRAAAAGSRQTLRLRLSSSAARAIKLALARRVRVTAALTVTATDAVGNRSIAARRTVLFKR
jgi:hypothetical protein